LNSPGFSPVYWFGEGGEEEGGVIDEEIIEKLVIYPV